MGSKHDLITVPQLHQSKRPRLPQSPHAQSSIPHSTYGKPMPLNLRRKVFISHSGQDKEFVRHLHKALCRSYHGTNVDFFDEVSIPKGKVVTMENILEEARTSKLAVLVLTDDFFMYTQNPMLELEAFVDAKVQLLPLFFTMSVEEFKAKGRRDKWVQKWREWLVVDDKLESWGQALSLVSKFCGLEFCKIATNESDYIDEVVKEVIRKIGPAIPSSEEGVVHGKDRLCEMVDDMYKEAESNRFSFIQNTSNYTQATSTFVSNSGFEEDCRYITSNVVGIYGFAGLGKTTLCKWLCDYYHRKFNGRVCYVDVGSSPASCEQNSAASRYRLQHVLSSLSLGNYSNDSHQFQHLSNGQLKSLLKDELSSIKDPVFLAIDNIDSATKSTSERGSQEEADWFLGCKFPEGSKIFITSRSESILANLSGQRKCSFSVVIAAMPQLTFEEARDIFVQEFPDPRELEEDDVNECVNMCTIHRKRYHPLMLKSLAAFIRWDRFMPNIDWKGRLAKLRSKGIVDIKDDVWKKVFSVLELTYEFLSEKERKVFLDLAIVTDANQIHSIYEWINMVYSHLGQNTLENIFLQLQDMCFIERTWFEYIEVPNLLVDFGKYKARHEGKYVVVDASTIWPDPDHLPSNARHISICNTSGTQLDLRDVEGVEVLHLVDNAGLQEVLLSPTTCVHSRSLIVIVPTCTTLCCIVEEDWPSLSRPRRGSHFQYLKWMQLQGNVVFQSTGASGHLSERGLFRGPSDRHFHSLTKLDISKAADPVFILACPCNLKALKLRDLPNVQSIDLTTGTNLQDVRLSNMPSLKFIHGLEGNLHHLQEVKVFDCDKLSALTISATSEANHDISSCLSLEKVSFWAGSGAECRRTSRHGTLRINATCPNNPGIVGLAQYTGRMWYDSWSSIPVRLEDVFGRFPSEDAGADCSICKAQVMRFDVNRYNQAGLAGVVHLSLEDAQHIGFFISALFQAEPKELTWLEIGCKRGGDCGCDQNAPCFGPLPWTENQPWTEHQPRLTYSCPQVRDLSSLAQWHVLKEVNLNGCMSVEKWPDFAAMTLLEELVLSNTSLKEWPAAVLLLPYLQHLDLSGCRELPAEELIKSCTIVGSEPTTLAQLTCKGCSLASLSQDLREGTRDRCSVADALDALSPELEVLFDRWPSSTNAVDILVVQELVVEIMYLVWFGFIAEKIWEENLSVVTEEWQYLSIVTQEEWQYIRGKMRRLLCSKSFLSLPFRACNERALSAVAGWGDRSLFVRLREWREATHKEEKKLEERGLAGIGAKGIALVGGALSFECSGASLDKNCVLNLLQSPVKDELFNRITCSCPDPGVHRLCCKWKQNAHNLSMQVRQAADKLKAFI